MQASWQAGAVPHVVPFRPVPVEEHASAPALEVGCQYLQQLFSRFLRRLPPEDRGDLRAWLAIDMHGKLAARRSGLFDRE